jgi:hypothetical protein
MTVIALDNDLLRGIDPCNGYSFYADDDIFKSLAIGLDKKGLV